MASRMSLGPGRSVSGLPKVWPQLEAKDFCHGRFNAPGGRHCLLGWFYESCDDVTDDAIDDFYAAFCRITNGRRHVAGWSDTHSFAKCAELWNAIGEELGYTEWVRA